MTRRCGAAIVILVASAHVYTKQHAIRSRQIMSEKLAKANAKAKELVATIESDVVRLNQMP
jgi:hypothetical protein